MINKKLLLGSALAFLVACNDTKAPMPEPYGAIPSQRQLDWHQLEYYAFIHFNMNTFTDMEWGMGSEKPEWFNPTELDAEQWVKVIKDAGMKGVILTAKHHDGFCLWPSKYTEHSVKNSPWRDGKGDLVKELSDACKKHGIKFGVYLSPWDRNHPEYARQEYVTYFHNQLRELLTNYGEIFEVWFDGANGGTGYYGGANERRNIDADTYYQWDKVEQIVRELQPNAVIFGDKFDIRWVGNEEGVGGEVSWCPINIGEIPQGLNHRQHLSRGDENGKDWIPAEVDVSIRPGWYYHKREDHQVKSLQHLVDIYYHSVGRNASLLLNFPVDTRGLIHEKDVEQVMKLKETIDRDFQTELAHKGTAQATSTRASNFAPNKAIDRDVTTFWAPEQGVVSSELVVNFDKPITFNRVLMQEYIALGQRVKNYEIQALINNDWQVVHKGETIGYKTIVRLNPLEANAIRLVINQALAEPLIASFEVYNAPSLLVAPDVSRDKDGYITLSPAEKHMDVYYTLDGSIPTKNSLKYTDKFLISEPTQVTAIAYDQTTDKYSENVTKRIDISKEKWTIKEVSSGKIEKAVAVIDENPISEFYTDQTGKKQHITIDMNDTHWLKGFTYMPPQARWAYGTITQYEFYVSLDAKKWNLVSKGEFSNVKNNPILQEIPFEPTKARFIRLVALDQTDDSKAGGFAEIGVITQ